MRKWCPLLIAAVLGVAVSASAAPPQASAPPNITLLLADDMGWADPFSIGGEAVRTPNLDRLAAGGARFTRFYAASAVCSPTRASILTGRYPLRFGITGHFPDDESRLPRGTITLPRLLKRSGYATAHAGKWHLGGLHLAHIANRADSIPGPHEHGFDHCRRQIEEQPPRADMGRERTLYRRGGTCLIRNERRVESTDEHYGKHFTDSNGDFAVEMIERFAAQGRPFFLKPGVRMRRS